MRASRIGRVISGLWKTSAMAHTLLYVRRRRIVIILFFVTIVMHHLSLLSRR